MTLELSGLYGEGNNLASIKKPTPVSQSVTCFCTDRTIPAPMACEVTQETEIIRQKDDVDNSNNNDLVDLSG